LPGATEEEDTSRESNEEEGSKRGEHDWVSKDTSAKISNKEDGLEVVNERYWRQHN
jgi:hypothetical protein